MSVEQVNMIMELVQEYASAWSLVGSRFDLGGAIDDARDVKAELRFKLVETFGLADYETVIAGHRLLVRELDFALNGTGAAKQASLCDIVAQIKNGRWKLVQCDTPPTPGAKR